MNLIIGVTALMSIFRSKLMRKNIIEDIYFKANKTSVQMS